MKDSTHYGQQHETVLRKEAVQGLAVKPEGCYVDATFGRGGHSEKILAELSTGRLIGIDRDMAAIDAGRERFAGYANFELEHAAFSDLAQLMQQKELVGKLDGVLLDIGVSSPQLDDAERGFSFMRDGPLDMRMDTSKGITAAQWLLDTDDADIVFALKRYGEERFAKRIVHGIRQYLLENELETTAQLAAIVSEAIPVKEKGKHPATRTFQAIRIVINDELGQLAKVLPQALELLAPGGRLVVISFHSLEDRMVKRFMRDEAKGDTFPPDLPVTADMLSPTLRLIGKATKASDDEVHGNRRARSAVMRVAEKR